MNRNQQNFLALTALAIVLGGCSRPPEQIALPEWERNPGLKPKPAGRILAVGEKEIGENTTVAAGSSASLVQLDSSAAELEYQVAVEAGHVWAMTRLGALYARSENTPALWQRAAELLGEAAEQGDAEANYELAGMYSAGRGLPKSDFTAFGHMKEAAARGMAAAQYELAGMYLSGRGTAADKAAAVRWARRAAEQEHLQGQFFLGSLLLESPDEATSAQGADWLDRAAAAGHRQAALVLSAALARGENNLAKDELRAEQLVKPLADQGDVDAQFIVAWLYTFADEFADRRALARDYLQMAAASGHGQAAAALEELKASDKRKH